MCPVACCAWRGTTCAELHIRSVNSQRSRYLCGRCDEELCCEEEVFPLAMNDLDCYLPCIRSTVSHSSLLWCPTNCTILYILCLLCRQVESSASLPVAGTGGAGLGEGNSSRTWLLLVHLSSWPCFYLACVCPVTDRTVRKHAQTFLTLYATD